jgi:hypothetical protein
MEDHAYEQTIFLVTTLQFADPARNMRCVGFYYDHEEADDLVVNNRMDISEDGYYRFAVIEQKSEGIYCTPYNEWWYKYNRKTDKYERCEKPEKLHNIICFGIG